MKKICVNSLSVIIIFLLGSFCAVAQECGVIYVTPAGASSGLTGTKSNPASLSHGLTLVSPTDNRIWLATGTYPISNQLNIPSNATIEGGFDGVTWIKSNNAKSIIHRDNSNALPPSAMALIGLIGNGVSGFRLQDLTVMLDNAPLDEYSVYGIYLSGCSDYNIVRCEVITGNGGNGIDGTAGTDGVAGLNGGVGGPGNGNEAPAPGGAGGTGASNGGNGAPGGKWNGGNNSPGQPGQTPGCGGNGGGTASGGSCSCGNPFNGCPGNCGGAGSAGGSGQSGSSGVSGGAGSPGSVVAGYFQPGGQGGNGTDGTNGCGGGGGGGGGGRQQCGQDDVGGSGGGGGGGGGGGTAGTGGTGGGGSFAIFLISNGANGVIQDCSLQPGAGGSGGIGGAGGVSGAGGTGGNGGAGGPCGNAVGARGGNGGSGGAGGSGGSGAAGPSTALSENGGTPVSAINNNGVPGDPPVISVANAGCTNVEVMFTAPTSGNWDFGAGSSPSTTTSSGPIAVIYNSLGRKSITFSGTVFTEYLDIFTAQTPGGISIADPFPTSGCPDTFSTSRTGTLYEWDFGPNALPPTLTGANFQTAPAVFTAPGTYTVVLWVTTACCGRVRDTLNVTVQPNALNITLAASDDTICAGETITYTAVPSYQLYDFYLNNNLVQTSPSNSFSPSTINQGDSVVVIGFNGVCYSNPSVAHYPTVIPIPVVTLNSSIANDTICAGEPVTFTASPAGYDNYDFYDNGTIVQSSASEIYSTSSLASGNSIHVIATEAGCTSAASNAIITVVKPVPVISISIASTDICEGDNVDITASPTGLDNFDFMLNGSSVQNNNSNILSSLFNDGDNIVVTGSLNGCNAVPSNSIVMTVTPIPSVTLSSSAGTSICEGEIIIFTATPPGYDVYEFYDGTLILQSGTSEMYTATSLANGNSITVIAIENGCSSPSSNSISTDVYPQATAAFEATPLESDDLATVFVFNNQSVNSDSWLWDFGDLSTSTEESPSHVYADTGLYSVTLIALNQDGCNDTVTKPNYIYLFENPGVFIPGAFTPNGDGVNDILRVLGKGVQTMTFKIFNRWGQLVFETGDITKGWDGNYKGEPQQSEVFVYVASLKLNDGSSKLLKGSVTLLR